MRVTEELVERLLVNAETAIAEDDRQGLAFTLFHLNTIINPPMGVETHPFNEGQKQRHQRVFDHFYGGF